MDLLKISLVFALILFCVRLKWNVGYVLLLASGLLAALYHMPLPLIGKTLAGTVADPMTIQLFLALTLIRMVEMVLRENQVLARMMEASRIYLKNKKAIIISMPILIGMLPSLGGAYFSAPMVEEAARGLRLPAEEKSYINYWFRHIWEPILPIYPGFILPAVLAGLELRQLILLNLPVSLLMCATGLFFSMRGIGSKFKAERSREGVSAKKDRHLLLSFIPLLAILGMVIVLHMQLHYVLIITTAGLFLFYGVGAKDIIRTIRYGFSPDVIVLIAGVMVFKFMMDNSGAVQLLSKFFTVQQIPLLPILFLLPFVSGLLTGAMFAAIGSSFPLVLSIAGTGRPDVTAFAFAAAYLGVLVSPVHLCFVLTREYFKADIWGVYKKVIPACSIILAGALIQYFVLRLI